MLNVKAALFLFNGGIGLTSKEHFIKKLYDKYSLIKPDYAANERVENDCYDERIYFYLKEYYPNKNTRICDLGCGRGNKLMSLELLGYGDLVGVDLLCKSDLSSANKTQFIDTDMFLFLSNTLDDSFDVLIFNAVLEHLYPWEIEKLINECSRVLGKDGAIIIKSPNGASPFGGVHQFGDLTHKTFLNQFSLHQILTLGGMMVGRIDYELTSLRNFKGSKKIIVTCLQYFNILTLKMLSLLIFNTGVVLSPNFIALIKHGKP